MCVGFGGSRQCTHLSLWNFHNHSVSLSVSLTACSGTTRAGLDTFGFNQVKANRVGETQAFDGHIHTSSGSTTQTGECARQGKDQLLIPKSISGNSSSDIMSVGIGQGSVAGSDKTLRQQLRLTSIICLQVCFVFFGASKNNQTQSWQKTAIVLNTILKLKTCN